MRAAALALLLVLIAADGNARSIFIPPLRYEPITPAMIREQLCLATYAGPQWNGGATAHALRCALRCRL
jgi:hypothetical protein